MKQIIPHSQPDALLLAFAAVRSSPTGKESTERASDQIHNGDCWCYTDESKREFLGFEEFIDASQGLIYINL